MSLTVIMTEITNDVHFVLPLMTAILVAKWVADATKMVRRWTKKTQAYLHELYAHAGSWRGPRGVQLQTMEGGRVFVLENPC